MQEEYPHISAVILAAGESQRMNSCTPKVLHNLGCKPIIEYVICTALSIVDNTQITLVSNEILENNPLFQTIKKNYNMEAVIQEKKLGTADALYQAYKNKNLLDFVLVLYGDTPFISIKTIKNMLNQIIKGADLSLGAFIKKTPNEYGRLNINKAGMLTKIVEYRDLTNDQKNLELCNSGILLIKKSSLSEFFHQKRTHKNEFYLTDIVEFLLKKDKICSYVIRDEKEFIGINTRKDLLSAESYLQGNIHNNLLKNGITIIKPETSYFAYDISIEKDVIIYPNVYIGKNTKIGQNSQIHSFSHIENVKIGNNSTIGPFARIRPKSTIGNNSKIGNFIEIKNSNISNEVKIPHFGYIGDVNIEKNVNVGAGTVFCNYDGFKKNSSYVEKNSFIGANSTIISPVTIGEGSTIAASSTITKNLKKKELAISRVKQKNIPNKSIVKNKKF